MLYAHFHPEVMLAFFQSTQLSLFERFETQAMSGIDSTGITAGMQNVAYVVLVRRVPVASLSISSAWRGCPGAGYEPHQVCGHSGCGDELRNRVHNSESGLCERRKLDQ